MLSATDLLYERVLRSPYIQNLFCDIEKKLPDESCRHCGGTLRDCTQCAECKGVISMICNICGTRTIEQFHNTCMYHIETIQTYRVPKNQADSYANVSVIA